MLPAIAAVAAVWLPVSAVHPVVVASTSLNPVAPFHHHRCSEPLKDLTMRNFLVTNTTMPRCAAIVVWCRSSWTNERSRGISARRAIALDCELLQLSSASVSASGSLIGW